VSKLSIATPEAFLVERYLEEIAKAYNVDWRSPDSYGDSDDGGDEGVLEVCMMCTYSPNEVWSAA
jgi:hypothetical protein